METSYLVEELKKVLYAQFIREDILNAKTYTEMKYHQYFSTDTEYTIIQNALNSSTFEELQKKLIVADLYQFLRKMIVEFEEILIWGKKLTESLSDEPIEKLATRLYIKYAICGNYLLEYHKGTNAYLHAVNKTSDELFLTICHLLSAYAASISYKPTWTALITLRTENQYNTFDLNTIGIHKSQSESIEFARLFLDKFIHVHDLKHHMTNTSKESLNSFEIKKSVLKIVKELNKGRKVGYPSIDMRLSTKGVTAPTIKLTVDSCVEEELLQQIGKLSLQITDKGIQYLQELEKE